MNLGSLSQRELAARLREQGLAFRAGPLVFSVRSQIASIARALETLYADFPLVEPCPYADFRVELQRRRGLRGWLRPEAEFTLGGYFHYDPFPLRMAVAYLEWGLNCCVSRNAHQFLILHAATVERDGCGVVILGKSGAGKSTLCAGLVTSGWRLLSDELALISPANLQLSALARPISLKNEAIEVIRGLAPQSIFGPESNSLRKGRIVHLRPPQASVERAGETAPPRRFLFVNYQPGATAALTPISPGMAHMRIARQSFNYGILGETGFRTLADVVEQSQAFDFTYGNLRDAAEMLGRREFLTGRCEALPMNGALIATTPIESSRSESPTARADA